MDGWQAAQNWIVFGVVIGGLAYYYSPKAKKPLTQTPLAREAKKEGKPVVKEALQNGGKKRKVDTQPAPQVASAPVVEQNDDPDEIDMSTRQFAANMQKAREGIQVKSSSTKQARVKTVKPKASASNMGVTSSGSSEADVGADDEWSHATSPIRQAGAVDDMLEATATGPAALRITPAQNPVKEKAPKQAKKEVAETKKQRQNRKKAEEEKILRQELENERKALAEKQRRTAREARGEPAKNGISIPAAPVNNPWEEKNAARDAQLPAHGSDGKPIQLLDTLDAESETSSTQEVSTAATSTTDAAPSRRTGDVFSEDDLAKAVEESERESGWSEVKTSKKQKKKTAQNDGKVNVPAPKADAHVSGNKTVNKPVGFHALTDEYEQNGDDLSSWTA